LEVGHLLYLHRVRRTYNKRGHFVRNYGGCGWNYWVSRETVTKFAFLKNRFFPQQIIAVTVDRLGITVAKTEIEKNTVHIVIYLIHIPNYIYTPAATS